MWSGRNVVVFILVSIVALQLIGMYVLYQGQMSKRAQKRSGPPQRERVETLERAGATAGTDGEEPAASEKSEQKEPIAVIHGHVTGSDGKPLEGAVTAYLDVPGQKPRYVSVTPEGWYAFAGVRPGPCVVRVLGREYDETKATLEIAPGTTRHDVVLRRGMTIRIKFVNSEGEPRGQQGFTFTGPIAVATRDPVERLPMTELRSHNRFGLGDFQAGFARRGPKLPPGVVGELRVKAEPPFHVSAVYMHHVLSTQAVTAPVEELTFVIDQADLDALAATVKMRVMDAETGEPIKGRVGIGDRQSSNRGVPIGEDGSVVYPDVPPGLKHLTVFAAGYEFVNTFVRVAEGEVDLGTLRLHKAGTVEGKVLRPDGKPTSVRLLVRQLDRMKFPQPLRHGMVMQSDTEGTFKIHQPGRGRYLVLADDDKYARVATVLDAAGGKVNDVVIRLTEGVPAQFEFTYTGKRPYLMTVRDAEGTPLFTYTVRGTWPRTVRLVPGTYELEYSEDGEVLAREELVVGSGGVKKVVER
ncbi:MAG: carboxypeptidase-like regulatory domain-containing protein [Planctomycetota bacterium]